MLADAEVNCAESYAKFNPAWGKSVEKLEADGVIEVLRFNWNDSHGLPFLLRRLPSPFSLAHVWRSNLADVRSAFGSDHTAFLACERSKRCRSLCSGKISFH